jgi:hypothetical protein
MLTLDQYTEVELQHELERRLNARNHGLCDYCNRPPDTPPCKFPERHQLEDIQRSDLTVDYQGHVLFIRPDLIGAGGELPKVFVVEKASSELSPGRRHQYNVIVSRDGTVHRCTIPGYEAGRHPNKLKVTVVDTRSAEHPEGDEGSANLAWQLKVQAEMNRDYLARRGASVVANRPGAETDLEMRLRAERTRLLLNWDNRRAERVHHKMLGKQTPPVVRKCRECGQTIEVEDGNFLLPHFRPNGGDMCLGTGCTCPEFASMTRAPNTWSTLPIDGDCPVHGVNGIKSRADQPS